MSEIYIGLIIFIASQYFLKLHLDPFKEFGKVRSEISFLVLSKQSELVSGAYTDEELSNKVREVSASLLSSYNSVWFRNVFKFIPGYKLPSKREVKEACQNLNIIAANVGGRDTDEAENFDKFQEIANLLKIDVSFSKRSQY